MRSHLDLSGQAHRRKEILSRLGGRRVHVPSGRSYHIEWNPPKRRSSDDETGDWWSSRLDDTEEAIKQRLKQYHDLARSR